MASEVLSYSVMRGPAKETPERTRSRGRQPRDSQDVLAELAGRILSDGGMPGKDCSRRALNSALALLAFAQQGHQHGAGPSAPHVRRLKEFVKAVAADSALAKDQHQILSMALERAAEVSPFREDWTNVARLCVFGKSATTPGGWLLLASMLSIEQGTGGLRIVLRDKRSQK